LRVEVKFNVKCIGPAIPSSIHFNLKSKKLVETHARSYIMPTRLFKNEKTNIKTGIKTFVSLAMVTVFLTGALASPKGAAKRILFEGYLQGGETDVLQGSPPEAISVDGNVTGIATHLGQFTLTYKVSVKLPEGSSTGSAELITTDGDRIFISTVGQGEPTDTDTPNLNSIVEVNTVTGGTGRFEGAIGSFTTKRLVDLATGFTSGSVHGAILFPGTRHGNH
jgi:hypothetical protein